MHDVEVLIVDPNIDSTPQRLLKKNIEISTIENAIKNADLFVGLVAHDEFVQLDIADFDQKHIVHTCAIWS